MHALQHTAEQRASRTLRAREKASAEDEGRGRTNGAIEFRTSVPVGPYRGVWGTVWWIVREEGVSVAPPPVRKEGVAKQRGQLRQEKQVVRKGQGLSGLWRGWRVGFWGLVGVWGASALGGPATGGEF